MCVRRHVKRLSLSLPLLVVRIVEKLKHGLAIVLQLPVNLCLLHLHPESSQSSKRQLVLSLDVTQTYTTALYTVTGYKCVLYAVGRKLVVRGAL